MLAQVIIAFYKEVGCFFFFQLYFFPPHPLTWTFSSLFTNIGSIFNFRKNLKYRSFGDAEIKKEKAITLATCILLNL